MARSSAVAVIREPEVRHILVGIAAFALLVGILGISYLNKSLSKRGGMGDTYHVSALFRQVDGLRIGDPVTLSGVRVGTVEKMTLDADFRARLTLAIEEDIQVPVDTSAAIHTDGLFGGKFVVLDPGGDEKMLGDGDVITYTQDSMIVGELLDLIIAEGRALRAPAVKEAP